MNNIGQIMCQEIDQHSHTVFQDQRRMTLKHTTKEK